MITSKYRIRLANLLALAALVIVDCSERGSQPSEIQPGEVADHASRDIDATDQMGRRIAMFQAPTQKGVYDLRFSPDGNYLISRSNVARVWDLRSKELACEMVDPRDFVIAEKYEGQVQGVAHDDRIQITVSIGEGLA